MERFVDDFEVGVGQLVEIDATVAPKSTLHFGPRWRGSILMSLVAEGILINERPGLEWLNWRFNDP